MCDYMYLFVTIFVDLYLFYICVPNNDSFKIVKCLIIKIY